MQVDRNVTLDRPLKETRRVFKITRKNVAAFGPKKGVKSKLSDQMLRDLIQRAQSGSFSARQLVSTADNGFIVTIVIRTMEQIVFEAPLIKYQNMQKLRTSRLATEAIELNRLRNV